MKLVCDKSVVRCPLMMRMASRRSSRRSEAESLEDDGEGPVRTLRIIQGDIKISDRPWFKSNRQGAREEKRR